MCVFIVMVLFTCMQCRGGNVVACFISMGVMEFWGHWGAWKSGANKGALNYIPKGVFD